eukprot:2048510-Prorocentrum_lima.AAC.1
MNRDPNCMGLLDGPRRQAWTGLNQTAVPAPVGCHHHQYSTFFQACTPVERPIDIAALAIVNRLT